MVIEPILKPGKDASDPSNYRPTALTSQLGKTMEKMVTERLMYVRVGFIKGEIQRTQYCA